MGTKTFTYFRKKLDFLAQKWHFWPISSQEMAKNGPNMYSWAPFLPVHLVLSWLVVVARGLYLTRHLLTLFSSVAFVRLFSRVDFQVRPQIACLGRCIVTLVAFVQFFSKMIFDMLL